MASTLFHRLVSSGDWTGLYDRLSTLPAFTPLKRTDVHGRTPFFCAVARPDADPRCVDLMLDLDVTGRYLIHKADDSGAVPLEAAAATGSYESMATLVEHLVRGGGGGGGGGGVSIPLDRDVAARALSAAWKRHFLPDYPYGRLFLTSEREHNVNDDPTYVNQNGDDGGSTMTHAGGGVGGSGGSGAKTMTTTLREVEENVRALDRASDADDLRRSGATRHLADLWDKTILLVGALEMPTSPTTTSHKTTTHNTPFVDLASPWSSWSSIGRPLGPPRKGEYDVLLPVVLTSGSLHGGGRPSLLIKIGSSRGRAEFSRYRPMPSNGGGMVGGGGGGGGCPGPAERLGLIRNPGDVVVGVGGRSVESKSFDDVVRLLREEVSSCRSVSPSSSTSSSSSSFADEYGEQLLDDPRCCRDDNGGFGGGCSGCVAIRFLDRRTSYRYLTAPRPCRDLRTFVRCVGHATIPSDAVWFAVKAFRNPKNQASSMRNNSTDASDQEDEGNLPLHVAARHVKCDEEVGRMYEYMHPDYHAEVRHLLRNRPVHLFDALLRCHPDAARCMNRTGRLPLHVAIDAGRKWEDGLNSLARAAPLALESRDVHHHLYPFMLVSAVATAQGRSDAMVETVYRMLRLSPSAVSIR